MRRPITATVLILSALIIGACSGTSSPSPGDGTAANDATVSAEAGNAAEPAIEAGSPAAEAGTVGTFSATACDLLTVGEVEAASGQSGVEAQPSANDAFDGESQCGFVANGVLPVVIVTVTGPNTNADPNGYLQLPESVRLSLNGADGVWVPAAGFVAMVIKHKRVVAVQVGVLAEGYEFQDVGAALAQLVADRMP